MDSRRESKRLRDVDVTEMYALKLGALWRALRREHLSLWMLCFYFFFEYVRPQSLYPVIDILPWAQISLGLSMITAILDRSVRWTEHIQNKLLVLFLTIVIISGVFAFRPAESLHFWTQIGGWAMAYFLVINVVNTERRLLLFLLAYCLFSLKMAQHGTIAWASRGFSFASYGLIGSPGWFRNSGEYAIQMLIYGSLAISIVYALKDRWGIYKKWILYTAASTGYIAIMGASSRGSQLALGAIGIWWLLKLKGGMRALLVISLLAFALYHLLPEEQMRRFSEMGSDDSSQQRLTYWQFAIDEVIPTHPVIGIGYHNWLTYTNFKHPEGMGPYGVVEEVHNIYLQAASELGFTGLTAFLILVIISFVANARTRKNAQILNNRFYYYGYYGLDDGVIGFVVDGSFVTVLYYPFFWIQFAMIAMLNNVSCMQVKAVKKQAARTRKAIT